MEHWLNQFYSSWVGIVMVLAIQSNNFKLETIIENFTITSTTTINIVEVLCHFYIFIIFITLLSEVSIL